MVTYFNNVNSWNTPNLEYRGLSTDQKPSDAPNNSTFIELDTGTEFYFSGGSWHVSPVTRGSSSSSGGGLPANFPAESASNANKLVGFDENGDYDAVDPPSGLPDGFPEASASNANKLVGFDENGDFDVVEPPSGLPAGFPVASLENANKYIGFDAEGNYVVKDAPSESPSAESLLTITVPQMEQSETFGGFYVAQIGATDLTEEQLAACQDLSDNDYSPFCGADAMSDRTSVFDNFSKAYASNLSANGEFINESVQTLILAFEESSDDIAAVYIICNNDLTGDTLVFSDSATQTDEPSNTLSLSIAVPEMMNKGDFYMANIAYENLTQLQQIAVDHLASDNYTLFWSGTQLNRLVMGDIVAYLLNYDGQDVLDPNSPYGAFVITTENGEITEVELDYYEDISGETVVFTGYTDSGSSASGGSLPANFPTEGAANANKYIGFDASGDYAVVDPSELEQEVADMATWMNEFLNTNDFIGNEDATPNTIKSPYAVSDMTDDSFILNNGSVRSNGSDVNYMVSPLIKVKPGTYGLKVVKNENSVGNIVPSSGDNNNGFGFFGADGTTVVARTSSLTSLGNDIYLVEVPSQADYVRFTVRKNAQGNTALALTYFNQWVLLPGADNTITSSFFENVGEPESDGTIDKIRRYDGSFLYMRDAQARTAIAELGSMDMEDMNAFMNANDLQSDVINILGVPFDLEDVIGFASIVSNGSVRNSANNNDRNYSVTPPIPVSPGTYALYVPAGQGTSTRGQLSVTNNGYSLYKNTGTTSSDAVEKVSFTDLGNNIYSIVVPQGASYIRFCFYHGYANDNVFSDSNVVLGLNYVNNNWVMIKSDSTDLTSADFVKKSNSALNRFVRSDGSIVALSTSELGQKKILVFGDSIWGNDRSAGISDFLAEYSGATVYNCAIGGTRITGDRSTSAGAPEWQAFDGVNLIHAKLQDSFTDQDSYASSVASYVASETLPLLKSVDMSDVDIVILAYGHNDFNADKTIASITSAYETVISEILTAYPKIRILVCTPPWRTFTVNDTAVDGDTYTNTNDDTLRDMADGLIEMAKANHVEVLDMLAVLPWRALTASYYLDSDSVHPSTEGNKVYAHVVHGKLRSMY